VGWTLSYSAVPSSRRKSPPKQSEVPRLRSGFRQRAQTPAERLNLYGAPSRNLNRVILCGSYFRDTWAPVRAMRCDFSVLRRDFE